MQKQKKYIIISSVMTVIQEMLFMNMPQDPFILFSFVNTQLRDHYASLEEFCRANCCEMQDICDKLSSAGFEYDSALNKFC